MYNNYFSNRISIANIKNSISSRIPSRDPSKPAGEDRQDFLDPSDNRIQRLQGFATKSLPNSQYVATSFGTRNFPYTKGQLVIITNGYASDGSALTESNTGYNRDFTGDIRLLDGGLNRIGQTFPPIGTMGYFAYNKIPDGWLEMLGQQVLFEKSIGFFKYDADGIPQPVEARNYIDSDGNAQTADYEETIETEFTPLYKILSSWGLAEISPSILGWTVRIPSLQGFFIRCLNPSSSGIDPNNRLYYPSNYGTTNRQNINGRYFTSGSSTTDSFGNIPVVNHRHYGNILHRGSGTGSNKDWGITNWMKFWKRSQVSASFSAGGITQTQTYDMIPYHSSGTSSGNYSSDYTAGRPSGISRRYLVGTYTTKIRKYYYFYHGWNTWNSVSSTNNFHDGYPANASSAKYRHSGDDKGAQWEIREVSYGEEWRANSYNDVSRFGFHSGMKYGRINSFIEHFHNNIWTYWHEKDSFSGPFLHVMSYGLSSTSYHNTWHWTNHWNDRTWWNSDGNAATNRNIMWGMPYHIKKSPLGTAKESETFNTGNDGDRTTTAGLHNHSIYNGVNGVFFRGQYENRPENVALRLCIKY